MLDVFLLGTAGTVPLPNRWLTSCLLRYQGSSILIDCGEGTQIALNSQKLSFKQIDTILLTHYHTDHTGGLPGLLLSMAKAERQEPITIIGPKGIEEILKGVQLLARYIPFPIQYIELQESTQTILHGDLEITAFEVNHRVTTYGYRFDIKRNRKFIKEKAEALEIPIKYWSLLQKGEEITYNGKIIYPDDVLGQERKGIRFVYVTDTRPTQSILDNAKDADLLIAEGMYGDKEKQENAIEHKHMMMQESAQIAKDANVKELWYTHYSSAMVNPKEYEESLKEIFENIVISKDGEHTTLCFSDEEEKDV